MVTRSLGLRYNERSPRGVGSFSVNYKGNEPGAQAARDRVARPLQTSQALACGCGSLDKKYGRDAQNLNRRDTFF